ncbi:MAG: phosphohydrolase [Nitrospirae bacterium GWC2_57_13]|jgi:hypothetical protein|nr:MAG: phosphohydrolase [Nitrospirae bacterium GWC1_57_7]OGW30033.1 MAG: phosphohydrolase [Nitrospirae bacterium GWC2_57_13]OGW41928.1 MAG: phosphohydrolase [Nitrospirae bacterium GWD2_57_8]HAS54997.1 phosphohydrolase [Nitrospiraceae bacterium]
MKPDNRPESSLNILEQIPLINSIMASHRESLGVDFTAYRNHCYRVANFCLALSDGYDAEQDKVAIAAAFHDLGIWTHRTFDYLGPSRLLVREYLVKISRVAWTDEVEAMVAFHHKLTPYRGNPAWLVEPFLKADWIDILKGGLKFGLPRGFVAQVLSVFPNAGFHRRLVELTMQRMKSHPFSPLPMMKW